MRIYAIGDIHGRLGLLQIALGQSFDGRLVLLVGLFLLAGLVLLPPLPAEDHRQTQGNAAQ